MQVKEIMTKNPEMLSMDTSLMDAAKKMKDLNVGVMPVSREDSVVGVVTDRDIVVRGIAERRDPSKTAVRDIMSSDVFTCTENTDIQEAAQAMKKNKVRRLVITDTAGKPVGIVSLGDIATKFSEKKEMSGDVLGKISEPSRPSHH